MKTINLIVFCLVNCLLTQITFSQSVGKRTSTTTTIEVPMDPLDPNDPIRPPTDPIGPPTDPVGFIKLYLDKDCDGFGSTLIGDFITVDCITRVPGDCDDNNDQITVAQMWYADADGDTFGNPAKGKLFCTQSPAGYVLNSDDCNDDTAAIHMRYWYRDKDGDSYGDPNDKVASCTKVDGYVFNSKDCDDNNASLPQNWFYDQNGDGFLSKVEYRDPVIRDDLNILYNCSTSTTPIPSNQPMPPDTCTEIPPGWTSELYQLFKDFGFNSKEINNVYIFNNHTVAWYYANIDFLDPSKYRGDYYLDDPLPDSIPLVVLTCDSPGPNYISYKEAKDDTKLHWIHVASYDIKGNVTGASRTYFDDLGKSDVSLSKDFVQNKVWGTETTFDNFGRPDRTSFVAPSDLATFKKVNFFKTTVQTGSSTMPVDLPVGTITYSQTLEASNTITATGAISSGLNVSFNAQSITLRPGFSVTATTGSSFTATAVSLLDISLNPTLANYYSDSNTLEPYQATASQPYSQANYDTLNPGNVINVVGGNKINGDWKTGYSYTVPAAQEMYYVYGSDYYDGSLSAGREDVITKFYKSISVDANGVENVAFSDGEGKLLASARSGGGTSYPVISLIGTQGFVDVHIPAGITSGISLIGGASLYTVYNLKTGAIETTLTGGNAYRVQANTLPTSNPLTYIYRGAPSYNSGALGIAYPVNYYDYAVNVYNKTGQLIKSIQPNGYVANSTIVPVPTHMTSNNFATTYAYNTLGQVIETTSPDEGTSKFAYRKDGQIRYSQSALQYDTKVSYTDYDTYGRPIESGVITNAAGIWATATSNADSEALIGTVAQRSEQTFTVYDDSINNQTSVPLPANLTLNSALTTSGIPATNYPQNNLSGNVAITYTKPEATITAITWYSYDIYGRTEWMVEYNEGIGAKTIHYEYDYKGNIKKVLYQKDKTAELFAHQYTYDANDVLKKVETSTDNTTFITHADYSYYLTGELKRVNIAQGLQGLDYVYTLGGQLKSINHPSLEAAKDPGGDANDVFGLNLDYYNGDYLRTGRNITSSPSVGADYNGNIKATRWANKGVAGDMSGNVANQKGYLYNYDRNNWLTGATFGNTNSSTAAISPTAAFSEGSLSYDPNGNIKTLQRTNDSSATVDNLTYNYTNAGKNQLNSVTDAVAATVATTDIDSQAAGNYIYDAIGQMTRNNQEDINYFYNTQGLVTQVNKGGNAVVKFFYNERGQRIKKESYNSVSPYLLQSRDYYILDLSGNVMSIYTQPNASAIVQKDLTIFGLSRLGMYNKATATSTYEITDHLGNVRAVVQKVNGIPVIKSFADYYPFGEQLPMRNSMSNYRYAFQGQELDTETNMEAFQLRLWDGRIGRWLSTDPYGQHFSPYMGMGNNPVNRIDPNGGEDWYLPKGETDQSKAVWIDGSGPQKGYDHLGGADFNFTGGWLNNVNVMGTPKSFTIGSSGAYGWNDGSAERFWDHMPITGGINSITNGVNSGSKSQIAWGVVSLAIDVFTFGEGSVGIKAAGGAVDAYALKAVESGFYPVMTRGFKKATELVYLEAGEVWKYGVTKNPLTRYTQKYLDNIGEFGVYYEPILAGARTEALQIEKMGILNYIEKHGFLPAGNKVKF